MLGVNDDYRLIQLKATAVEGKYAGLMTTDLLGTRIQLPTRTDWRPNLAHLAYHRLAAER